MNDERTTNLELALTHLQRDYDALNEVVLQNGKELRQLKARVKQLTDKLESQASSETVSRNAEDEKPPHY